jgi:pyridoxal phosphate enzyme (YggS family)
VLDTAALRDRLDGVRRRISDAAGRAGRDPSSIRLVAVSKTFSADHVRAAADAGQLDFGENKVQEAIGKIEALRDLPVTWHLIGHLQSNKARKAAERFHVVHTIDDVSILQKLEQAARASGRGIDLLVQVDLAGEVTKSGARPDAVLPIFRAGTDCTSARISGLMLLPPAVDDPNDARPYFAALRRLRDELSSEGVGAAMLANLSMGMSHDFEVAVEEGATIVRIGSAIFGERRPGSHAA